MKEKSIRILFSLLLLLPLSGYSMTEAVFEIGVGAGIFVVITILVVFFYVLTEIIANKNKEENKKET